MSITSPIVHPPNERLCIVRESYQAITGNDCEAALLNIFEQWHKWKTQNKKQARSYNETAQRHGDQPSQLETVYIWNTATELSEQLLGLYKETTVKAAVKSLATKGFITIQKNPNPAYGFDRKNYYTFEVEAVQSAINEMYFLKTTYAKVKNDRPSVEIDLTLVEIDRAITKNTYKENNSKNVINNTFVEPSSTPSFEADNLPLLNAKKEKETPSCEAPPFETATSYGENHIPEQFNTGFEFDEDAHYSRINHSALRSKINAVETPENTEPIQTDNYSKKDAPRHLKSDCATATVNDSNSKNEANAQTTQPCPPKREINECLQHDSSESVLYCEVELVEERKAKKPKGPAPTEFDVQVNDSLCQLFESWGYKTFKRDANQIRLMRTEDKRGENEIVFLLDYLQKFGDADKKLRWVEIRSPKSFRDKADSLIAEIKRNKANENRNQPQYAPDPNICPF